MAPAGQEQTYDRLENRWPDDRFQSAAVIDRRALKRANSPMHSLKILRRGPVPDASGTSPALST
jgi:hypothetical protein